MALKILISSAGRRAQLIDCFRESAQSLGVELHVTAADVKPEWSAACHKADAVLTVPPCTHEEFAPTVADYCRRNDVRLVVPTIDTELRVWSRHEPEFSAAGIAVAVSAPAVVAIAADKLQTATVLRAGGVHTPMTLAGADYAVDPTRLRWPVLLKPQYGSSSIGIEQPSCVERAVEACRANPLLVAQELWRGREFTINMFFDRAGTLRCAIPHWRIETRGGEVSKGRTDDVTVLRQVARRVADCLPGARGALCFQAMVNDTGEYAVFEINARFGGGYPLAHRAGARFAQWLLEEVLGLPSSATDDWRVGVTMLRFDDAVFIDS